MAVAPLLRIAAPRVAPYGGGLRDVVPITTLADPHLGGGVEYDGVICAHAGLAPGLCDERVTTDPEKGFRNPSIVDGPAIAVYTGVACDILGEPYDTLAAEALDLAEYYALAKGIWEVFFKPIVAPNILTATSGPLCIEAAVALAEDWAADNQPGTPYLWTSRSVATVAYANRVAVREGNSLITPLGSPIVAERPLGQGPGDPGGGDYGWLYVSGAAQLFKGPVLSTVARDTTTNESMAVAERIWAVTIECTIAAIQIEAPCT
jgi:hypothetical protein